ncbi:uncharacterized protein MELLADRAFT_61609 [Melampsora larici-populina 98AG31]|uniref:Uncharacterized protein n=1 Tax=Melampsora larici-populina (strain 98AG31 / pathotype 3-4-7) TaxID=747676 RepID=F4RFL6_MELLP|nr:uncharacterized protein MELLADRAFT_61609 [Melampsora larici-populina 98AG31]EGG08829.1 hypothetical protein MELLADRAFT_61609 [Melampsora larici-populina 98AG31]
MSTPLMQSGPLFEPNPTPSDTLCDPPLPLSHLQLLDTSKSLGNGFGNHPNAKDDTDGHICFDMLSQALESLENLKLEDNKSKYCEEEETQDPNLTRARAQEAIGWHPFKNKEVSEMNPHACI